MLLIMGRCQGYVALAANIKSSPEAYIVSHLQQSTRKIKQTKYWLLKALVNGEYKGLELRLCLFLLPFTRHVTQTSLSLNLFSYTCLIRVLPTTQKYRKCLKVTVYRHYSSSQLPLMQQENKKKYLLPFTFQLKGFNETFRYLDVLPPYFQNN